MVTPADHCTPTNQPRRSRFHPFAATTLLAAVVAIAAVYGIAAVHPIDSSPTPAARAGQSSPTPDRSQLEQFTDADTRPVPQNTDPRGFIGYPGAQCDSANPAVALGRTAESLVVICQNFSGGFYYKGLGLKSGVSSEVGDCFSDGNRFVAVSGQARYVVSPGALTISRGPHSVVNEPMVEYWYV
jgi:hypothetical protein